MHGVVKMALADEGMMGGGVMIAGLVTSGGFAMVARGVLVMFGGFAMMLDGWMRHGLLLTRFRCYRVDRTPG